MSLFGVELFMLVEGSVDSPIWCYFITEVQKQVIPKLCYRTEGLKESDILLVYDNASAHNGKISGWWMRNINCFKLTISPYTPEFNPVERFFNSIKSRCRDGVIRKTINIETEWIVYNINKIPKNNFISYF